MMSPRRLLFGTSIALVLAATAASVVTSRRSVTVSARKQAAAATARLDSVFARRDPATRALSLAYLERARLGLGSPFRLIDLAAHDARLSDSVRRDLAWAIAGRVLDGRIYEVDARALDFVSRPGSGVGHLALIEDVVGHADDPRTAESALRLAYALAASNSSTGLTSLPVVAEVMAQVRDRALAEQDVRRAVARASHDGVDLIDELRRMRAARELAVEAPLLGSLDAPDREAAIDMAPELLRRIESITPSSDTYVVAPSLLDEAATRTLADLAPHQPPLAAVRVPVVGRIATLRADSTFPNRALAVISAAANEESLVAAFAYADRSSEGRSGSLRRLMVSVGVALRAHAQDQIVMPAAAPSVGAVVGQYGLKGIAFDADVPRSWRPFYTRMIASALDDFDRAIPGYDPTGLSFHVETGALPDSALAMHDPRTHTIRLSAMTPSGTLAHELAHDVDWQAARRLFATSGGYATDRSLRESGVRLASSVRGLTAARVAGRGRISPRGSSRPAEVFARSIDWFVADALAAMGRSNGYLTAIEDPLLTGFAATPSDAPSLDLAGALTGTLAEMTYVPDSISAGFVERWSTPESLDPSTVVQRTLETPIFSRRPGRIPFGLTREMVAQLATGVLCRVDAMRDGTPEERLMTMAIDARARGIVARRSRYTPAYARTDSDLRAMTAAVAEGFGRSGLIELAPAPFRPRCE
jgi:hypothetical protein